MAWVGFIKTRYKNLVVRVEDTPEAGCLVKLYDGETIVGEESDENPQQAVAKLVQLAQRYLNDNSITAESIDWAQKR